MKQILLLTLTLLLTSHLTFGQYCGTDSPTSLISYSDAENARTATESYCVDIFFYVVRTSLGTNAFSLPDTDAIIQNLNQYYSPLNIVLNNAGIDFIDDTDLLVIDASSSGTTLEETRLYNTKNRSDAISYYIVQGFTRENLLGRAEAVLSNKLMIRHDQVLTTVSPHELGHCFNLAHPFQGTLAGTTGCAEALDGSNCKDCGDKVCDTPATSSTSSDNIMSLSLSATQLTNGQGIRIRNALGKESILANVTSGSCARLSSVNTLCYPNSKTVNVLNSNGATTTWTSSSNVQILSSTNGSAQIKGRNYNEEGWIKAILSNGIELTEVFTVNVPDHSKITVHKSGDFKLYNTSWSTISAKFDGNIDANQTYLWEWQVPSSNIKIPYSGSYYIQVNPIATSNTSIYIRTRACNSCGDSEWAGRWFEVIYSGSGEGPKLKGPIE